MIGIREEAGGSRVELGTGTRPHRGGPGPPLRVAPGSVADGPPRRDALKPTAGRTVASRKPSPPPS